MSEARVIDAGVVARMLGVTERTVRRWAECGVLAGWRLGGRGHWRFDASSIQLVRKSDNSDKTDKADKSHVDMAG